MWKKKYGKLTPNQKEFIEGLKETGDIRASAIRAYGKNKTLMPTHAEKIGIDLLQNNPRVSKELLRCWDQVGMHLPAAAAQHYKVLMGKGRKIKAADILRAVEMVYKGYKLPGFTADDEEKQAPQSPIQIFIDQRVQRGLPIPKEIEDALQEEKQNAQ